jgi:hypothetical protein
MKGFASQVYDVIVANAVDGEGTTNRELRLLFNVRAKKVFNAIKYLTRLKLITKTSWEGTLNRYYPKR